MIVTIDEAKEIINFGLPIAIPTDTVYGLAASACNLSGIDQIFSMKKRSKSKKLPVFISSYFQMKNFINNSTNLKSLEDLANLFWPGPLTIVTNVNEKTFCDLIVSKDGTCAFRIPDHEVIIDLVKEVGPIAVTSSNLSGKNFHCSVDEIELDFGKDFPILEGPKPKYHVESTIVKLDSCVLKVLRHGAISCSLLEESFFGRLEVQKCIKCVQHNEQS